MTADVYATIASYEDPDTPMTCASLLADPGLNVRLHVVLQTDDLGLYQAVVATGAEVLHIPRANARGCCWARAKGQLHWHGERYWAQFDSHTRFEPGWALTLARQLDDLPGKAALSSYALAFGADLRPHHPGMTSDMVLQSWGDDGWHCAQSTVPIGELCPDGKPVPGRTWSAHLHFSPAYWIEEVPYDPQLWFSGEEQSTMLRAWTHGWDIYAPAICPVYHRYVRTDENVKIRMRQNISEHMPDSWKQDVVSKDRIARLYGWERPYVHHPHWHENGVVLPPDGQGLGVYGLGTDRTLEEFTEWSGLDVTTLQHLENSDWRRKLAGEEDDWDALMTHGKQVYPGNQRGGPFAAHVPDP